MTQNLIPFKPGTETDDHLIYDIDAIDAIIKFADEQVERTRLAAAGSVAALPVSVPGDVDGYRVAYRRDDSDLRTALERQLNHSAAVHTRAVLDVAFRYAKLQGFDSVGIPKSAFTTQSLNTESEGSA